ncbi:MAG: hypothetical protein ACK4WD_14375 [Flavobacteriales bacterium]|jgi:outer membrane protein assembly factor BamD (BamD/ComL family)
MKILSKKGIIALSAGLLTAITSCNNQPTPLNEKDQLLQEISTKESEYKSKGNDYKKGEYENMVTQLKTFTAKYPDDPKGAAMMRSAKEFAKEMGRMDDYQSFSIWYMDYCKQENDCEQAQLDVIEANFFVTKDVERHQEDLERFIFEYPDSKLVEKAKEMMSNVK